MKTFAEWWNINWGTSGTPWMLQAAESAWIASEKNSAAEISRLKGVIAKCKDALEELHYASTDIAEAKYNTALAAIKEIEK